MYLYELIDQQKVNKYSGTKRCLSLKLPPPSRNCSDTCFERSFTYVAPYEWNKLDERARLFDGYKHTEQ